MPASSRVLEESGPMSSNLPFPLLTAPEQLASCYGWSEDVYRDLLAVQEGSMSHDALERKYLRRKAVLSLDLTGQTAQAPRQRALHALLRIFDAQKVCIPALREHGASAVRCADDDLVALFDEPEHAVEAAFDVHRRLALFNQSGLAGEGPPLACIGIGVGDVFTVGPNLAMGDEVNRAAKLGEDLARGNETLVTANVYFALRHRPDIVFEQLSNDDQMFPYYRASFTGHGR
jgi:class 3 adenylate cyclase